MGKKHKHKSDEKESRKRKRLTLSSSDSLSDSSSSSEELRHKKSHHKKKKSHSKKKKDHHKKKEKKKLKKKVKEQKSDGETIGLVGPEIPLNLLEETKKMTPITKEEWEKRQSEIRRVFDEETGRYRLIRGDGEIVEEIVSRERHKAINKQATLGDGQFFQAHVTKR